MKVRYHPDARMELLGTTEWYEERRERLGADFLTEVKKAETMMAAHPGAWPRWPNMKTDVRRFRLARFPYDLAFQILGDSVVVLAVAHQRRAPFYWRDRVK